MTTDDHSPKPDETPPESTSPRSELLRKLAARRGAGQSAFRAALAAKVRDDDDGGEAA